MENDDSGYSKESMETFNRLKAEEPPVPEGSAQYMPRGYDRQNPEDESERIHDANASFLDIQRHLRKKRGVKRK